jgi:ribonuclease Z
MTFSFTVLGSSAAVAANDRNLSAHLLNANERFHLIDCGEGTQFQLRKYHLSIMRIRHIYISHLHGDHFFGLVGLLNTMHLLGRRDELTVFGPPELEEIIDLQLRVSQTRLRYPVVHQPLRPDGYHPIVDEDRLEVHSFPLHHSIPAWGFVFREKKPPRKVPVARSLAYCCDTAYDERIVPWISNARLLYHEATFASEMESVAAEKLHATAAQAAAIALKAGVGRLLIGHFSARYEDVQPLVEEARVVFPETYAAEEGVRIEI